MRMKKRKRTRKCSGRAAALAALALVLWLTIPAARQAQASGKKKPKVAAEAILFGSVFQENGFLLRGARVVVWNAEQPKERKEALTDMQGEFAVRVPAGKARYTVEVSAKGFAAGQKTVEIEADERVDLSFQLAPAGK